jgi:hypothetical protein
MKHRSTSVLVLIAMMTLLLTACGSSPESEAAAALAKVTPSETVFTLDDLLDAGFKKGKTFDVEGLTGAVSAYYGFWGVDPYDRKEFEARFYGSHSDAVELGTIFAEERTGPDALIKSGESSWDEGSKEARACTRSAGGDSSNCRISKYGDYVIYGNMILICQGRDSSTSLEQCAALLGALSPGLGVGEG